MNSASGILEGLFSPSKSIHPKYLYDKRGSALYDLICDTPDYYPTRTELSILRENRKEIADLLDSTGTLIEIGAGSIEKSATILTPLRRSLRYVVVDLAPERLIQSETAVKSLNPSNDVMKVEADFTQPIDKRFSDRGLVFFPGSTIGNFSPKQAIKLLRSLSKLTSANGGILIGVDLEKDRTTLEAAYNDKAGFTAAFNLNLLHRIRDETGIPFKMSDFRHLAFDNEKEGRVEMHLISRRSQCFTWGGQELVFESDEPIHTENSYKYSLRDFKTLAQCAGLRIEQVWTDPREWFSLQLLRLDL